MVSNGKWLVPEALQGEVCKVVHDHHHVTTSGFHKLWLMMDRFCQGEGLKEACHKVVQECPQCQLHMYPNKALRGALQPTPVPAHVFDHVSLDVFHFPEVKVGPHIYDSVLLMVDMLSGYVVAVPTAKLGLTGEKAAKLVLQHWLDVFGAPVVIRCDRGPAFVSAWFQTVCAELGLQQAKAQAGRHQSNGKAEVTGKLLRQCLVKAESLQPGKSWLQLLPHVIRRWHATPGPSGYSPNQLVFGRDLAPWGLPRPVEHAAVEAERFIKDLQGMEDAARKAMAEIQIQRKAAYDAQRGVPPSFFPGDYVWVQRLRRNPFDKHAPYWDGPFQVKKKVANDVYAIDFTCDSSAVHPLISTCHVDRLRPAVGLAGKTFTVKYSEAIAKAKNQASKAEETHRTDKVIAHRVHNGVLQFRVRWEGCTEAEDTWEPVHHFLPNFNQDWAKYVKANGLDICLSQVYPL